MGISMSEEGKGKKVKIGEPSDQERNDILKVL